MTLAQDLLDALETKAVAYMHQGQIAMSVIPSDVYAMTTEIRQLRAYKARIQDDAVRVALAVLDGVPGGTDAGS